MSELYDLYEFDQRGCGFVFKRFAITRRTAEELALTRGWFIRTHRNKAKPPLQFISLHDLRFPPHKLIL